MKKSKLSSIFFILLVIVIIYDINGCKPSQAILDKSGATLWSENCQRCHNLPPPTMYYDDQWKAIVTHMQVRANITKTEADKVLEFIQSAN